MKPVISEADYKLLYELLTSQKSEQGKNLGQEMASALIVKNDEMDAKTIRLNSYVEVQDTVMSKCIKLKIVMPDCADLKNHKLSVFAPLSVALIGYKEKDVIPWKTPVGETTFKILKVSNE